MRRGDNPWSMACLQPEDESNQMCEPGGVKSAFILRFHVVAPLGCPVSRPETNDGASRDQSHCPVTDISATKPAPIDHQN